MADAERASGEPPSARRGLAAPRFLSFLAVQFLLALCDNGFKVSVLFAALEGVADERQRIVYSSAITALFAVPWLLLSPLAGYLADRFRKDRVLLALKLPETLFMGLAVWGFASGDVALLLCVFVLITAESALFSPAKYGILPEIFGDEDLAAANGLLGMTTNLAVLLGTVLGGALAASHGRLGNIGWIYVGLAGLGTLCALYLPRAPAGLASAPLPSNPLLQTLDDWVALRALPALGSTVLGIMYFTFLGALLLTLVPVYCSDVLGLATDQSALVLTALVVGVAAGSLAAGWLSRGRVELGLVPLGALLMAVFSFDIAFFPARARSGGGVPLRGLVDFALLGTGGGLFNVPLLAALQRYSPPHARGRVIAFSNVTGNLMLLAAAGLPLALLVATELLGVGGGLVHALMIALHGVTVAGALYIAARLPDYGARFAVYLLVSLMYRMRSSGAQHIPRGGALLVANHVSWVDALVVTAASGRMVRFLMYRPFYETPGLNWLFRRLHVIPVAGGDDAERTQHAIERARDEIRAGHTVCIFAEGAITRTGQLLEFRRGLERIAAGLEAPIVPVYLHGLWGSLFSFRGGRLLLKWPRRLRARVHVLFGPPLDSSSSAFAVRQAVQRLSVDAREFERDAQRTLGLELLRSARRRWRRICLRDPQLGALRYGQALTAALRVRDRSLAGLAPEVRRVGVLLPPGAAALLAHWAVLLAGRAPVHLPAESGAAARAALRAAGVRQVLGSPQLWRALELGEPDEGTAERVESEKSERGAGQGGAAELLPLELDAAALARARRGAWLRAGWLRVLPLALARRALIPGERRDAQAEAAVVFTRGSSGPAKAVVLSHRNLLSNLLALREVLDIDPDDRLLCPAPLWHSFGCAAGIGLPLLAGASVTHPRDGSDPAALREAARCARPTVLLASPTSLAAVADADPGDFAELALVITGGEPLAPELRAHFRERFGVEPLEGYGCAECSPLISLNVPDFSGASNQAGSRPGTLGHPLPGVAVQIVDPHSGEPLPPEQPGRIRVRGPNVARAYLDASGAEHATRGADGWYDTGDLGALDRAGFLSVSGRAGPTLGEAAPEAAAGE